MKNKKENSTIISKSETKSIQTRETEKLENLKKKRKETRRSKSILKTRYVLSVNLLEKETQYVQVEEKRAGGFPQSVWIK